LELKEQTELLIQTLNKLKQNYETNHAPENIKDRVFFQNVKEQTLPVYEQLEKWEDAALKAVKDRIINVHPQQIASTKENMELLLMHSFYIDVKRKRYMELYNSIRYIFDQIVRELT